MAIQIDFVSFLCTVSHHNKQQFNATEHDLSKSNADNNNSGK